MGIPRVGVLTDDLGLVVSLGLRHGGLDVERLASTVDATGHDVVLVDLPRDTDVSEVLAALGDVPVVVLAGEEVLLPPTVAPVRRPCSLDQLLEAIDAVLGLPTRMAEAIPADVPVAASMATAPGALFTSHTPPALSTGWSSQPESGVGAGARAVETGPVTTDPVASELVARLRDTGGSTLGASTVVTAAIAEQLVEVLRDDLRADHVALWARHGDHHVVLALSGGGPGGEDVRLPADHELVRAAGAAGGAHLRNASDPGSPSTALVGVASEMLGVVLVEAPGPVDLVTVGGVALRGDDLARVRYLFDDPGRGHGS